MVDYRKFSDQMRPLADQILNSLKMKEHSVCKEVAVVGSPSLAKFLETHDLWF